MTYLPSNDSPDSILSYPLFLSRLSIRQLENEEVRGCPLLVMANKMDLPMTVSVDVLTEKMGLRHLARPWHVQPTCALTSQGLYEGIDWLAAQLS